MGKKLVLLLSGIFLLAGCLPEMSESDQILKDAYDDQISDIQVSGQGDVVRLLSDDTEGSQHQRFILELDSGQTLLVAHNIDIAPRIDVLSVNDRISFYGEYVWNAEGGIIHWTHHDPAGVHIDGWLKLNGITYQ